MTQERDIRIRLESDALTGDELDIEQVEGSDRISQLFSYTIRASRVDGAFVDVDDLMLKPASLGFTIGDQEVHRLFGLISKVRDVSEPQMQHPRMELTFVPRAFAATMRETLDIFMEMSIPDIIDACLTRCGLTAGDQYDISGLTSSYEPREFVVQYKETDFAFISRLCEHVGIFYFVDHSTGKDVLTFGDNNSVFPNIERTPEIPFIPVVAGSGEFVDRIGSVEVVSNALPQRYTVRDYNYRTPGVDLMASADVDPNGLGEIVEYGAHFKGPNEGQRFADIRAQELLSTKRVWHGLGTAPNICAGLKFMLTEHPAGDSELLVIGVTHRWSEGGTEFATSFEAIPAETRYRPPRLTPKPRISGSITGMIDAAAQDNYAEVDEQGRYRVRFMYDTAARGEGQASRLVRMAQPHAGEGYGMHFPLRPGVEVILTCIDGDPDRPIISGTVPNPKTASPVSSANRDRNLIRTGGGNEIDISDEAGVERIKMTTPHAGTVFQLGAPNEPEVGAVIKTSGSAIKQAKDTVGNAASVVSAIADIQSALVGNNVTSIAGIPNPLEGFDKFEAFASTGLKALKGLVGVADTIGGFGNWLEKTTKDNADSTKKSLEDEILKTRNPEPKYPDDARVVTVPGPNGGGSIEVRESEEMFRKRIIQEQLATMPKEQKDKKQSALTQATATAAAEDGKWNWYEDDVKPWTEGANDVIDAADNVIGTIKTVKDTWSKWHKRLSKGGNALAFAWAKGHVGLADAAIAESIPRHKAAVRMPDEHYNLIAATDSVILNGQQGNYLLGMTTAVHGENRCVVSSNIALDLDGGARAELAAQSVMVTGNLVLNLLSRKYLITHSNNSTTMSADGDMSLSTDKNMSLEAKKNYTLQVTNLHDAKAETVKWKSDKKFTGDVGEHLTWKVGGNYKMTAEKEADFHGKKQARLKSDKGGILASPGQTKVDFNKSNQLVLKDSGATLKSSKVEVSASATVTIKGSKVDVNGKVFLG